MKRDSWAIRVKDAGCMDWEEVLLLLVKRVSERAEGEKQEAYETGELPDRHIHKREPG